MMPHTTSLLTRLWRLLRLIAWVFASACRLYSLPSQYTTRNGKAIQARAKALLRILNIRLTGDVPSQALSGSLIVANHISWLDIFAILALYPVAFIGKQEIRRWPILGALVARSGTVFINRSNRRDIQPTNQAISQALANGQNVAFFPEARTGHGLTTLPFKAALFESAAAMQAPVQAIALRYYDSQQHRSTKPAYVGNMSLLYSLWRIVSQPEITIHIDLARLMTPKPSQDRFDLKNEAERFIRDTIAQPEATHHASAYPDNIQK